jgi:hypothetical protein
MMFVANVYTANPCSDAPKSGSNCHPLEVLIQIPDCEAM